MDVIAELEKGAFLQSHFRYEEAEKVYLRILDTNPDISDAHNLLGLSAFQRNDFNLSKEHHRKAIQLDPTRYDFYFNYSESLRLDKDFDEAIKNYQKSIDLKADFIEAFINMSICLIQKNQYEKAESLLNQALQLQPDNMDIITSFIELLFKQNKYNEIKRFCNLNRNLKHELIFNSLGLVAKAEKNIKRAIKYFQKGLEINPESDQIHNNLALAYKKEGSLNNAESHLIKACSLAPNDSSYHYNIAGIYVLQNKKEQALSSYRKVMKLSPENSSVEHMINALLGEDSKKAPQKYVQTLFDVYAETFEEDLVDNLQYKTPFQIAELIEAYFPNRIFHKYFDAGCGTGLCGEACKNLTRQRTGVDLSVKMLNKAEEKNIYNQLILGDVIHELSQREGKIDLITAADVIIYLGALEPFFAASFQKLRSKGIMAFSVELCEQSFKLCESGRYAHSVAYVKENAQACGFEIIAVCKENIRKNMGEWIEGALFLCQKP